MGDPPHPAPHLPTPQLPAPAARRSLPGPRLRPGPVNGTLCRLMPCPGKRGARSRLPQDLRAGARPPPLRKGTQGLAAASAYSAGWGLSPPPPVRTPPPEGGAAGRTGGAFRPSAATAAAPAPEPRRQDQRDSAAHRPRSNTQLLGRGPDPQPEAETQSQGITDPGGEATVRSAARVVSRNPALSSEGLTTAQSGPPALLHTHTRCPRSRTALGRCCCTGPTQDTEAFGTLSSAGEFTCPF